MYTDEADKSIEFVLDFPIDEYKLFDGFYWDLKQLRIHNNKKISLKDRKNNVYTPSHKKWKLAKAHAQVYFVFDHDHFQKFFFIQEKSFK